MGVGHYLVCLVGLISWFNVLTLVALGGVCWSIFGVQIFRLKGVNSLIKMVSTVVYVI